MFFETYFGIDNNNGDEQKVLCPFPHHNSAGTEHKDFHPSLQVNLKKRVFYCPACGAKGNEIQFIQRVFSCTSPKATKFLNTLKRLNVSFDDLMTQWRDYSDDELIAIDELDVDADVLRELGVFVEKVDDHYQYQFPVTWNGYVCDIRTYRPGCTPKVLSEQGAQTGLVIPFDIWQSTDKRRWTILCAGEKDMAVARSRGLNAITLTGGEVITPLSPEWFKDRKVAICYDNDFAGINGANKVAAAIAPYASEVRVVTKFHEAFGAENTKEDITDWFTKYGGTTEILQQYIKDTEPFSLQAKPEEHLAPLVPLREAVRTCNIGKELRSDIQIITTSDSKYDIPCHASIKKFGDSKGRMKEGDTLTWAYNLDDDTVRKDIVFQMVGKSRDKQQAVIRKSLHLDQESGIGVFIKAYHIMYVCKVSDKEGTEADMYFLGEDPGRHTKLNVTYYRLDNPDNGECALLAFAWSEPVDDIEHFEITEGVKQSITYVQNHEGSVHERVLNRAEAVRGLLGYEANVNLIKAIDLCFNSVKEYHYGNQKNVKGFIDCLVIGESRIGKSDTAKRLRDEYDIGAFISLAGSAATIPGIIGGSVKDAAGRNATKAGVLPRNNGGFVCFEELAKCERELIKSLTDVRSSGLARITRVSGSVEIPAAVRMCTLSNVRPTSTGETRPIDSYSSGVEIVKDLIGTAEDIARYDYIYIQGDDGTESDPLYIAPDAYPTEVLQDVLRWAWSRKADDIVWEDDVEVYLSEKAKELNHTYPMHIKLFGTECWKKLARISCAVAAYICNTDETYSHLIITKEIVDEAVDFMRGLYDNDTFKVMVIVNQTKAREEVIATHTAELQSMYIKLGEAFDYLFAQGHVDVNTFKDLTQLSDNKEMSGVIRKLINYDFITKDSQLIFGTPKFRKTYNLLDKHTEVARV